MLHSRVSGSSSCASGALLISEACVCVSKPISLLKSHYVFPSGSEEVMVKLNHSRCSEPNRPFKNITRFPRLKENWHHCHPHHSKTSPPYKTAPYAAVNETQLMLNQDSSTLDWFEAMCVKASFFSDNNDREPLFFWGQWCDGNTKSYKRISCGCMQGPLICKYLVVLRLLALAW